MKSLIIHIVALLKRRLQANFVIVGMVAFISPVALASSVTWSLDSNMSDARFFQGSPANPDSLNTGVARVFGKVELDTNNLDNSVFDLSIYPADEPWAAALSPEGNLPSSNITDATDHTLLTFKSTRIQRTTEGRLEVIGDLTLTRVERSISIKPSVAYSGPVYGEPVIRTERREVAFLFPSLSAGSLAQRSTPATPNENGDLKFSGSARVGYESFPELLNAIRETNWPTVVQNEQCQMPSTIGEDYSGAQCSGTLVSSTRDDNCRMPATLGDDYSGPLCTPAAGNETTIVLELKLLPTGSDPQEVLSGNGTIR
jgi:polyisoprenoid-binding protein YceI